MDILSHALWSSAAAKIVNRKSSTKTDTWWAGFWGAFPDLLAFTVLFLSILWQFIDGAGLENVQRSGSVGQITGFLYPLSHSFLVFLLVFGIVSLIIQRPAWAMGGWGLHVLLDIGTHPAEGYPTRFLWPFSQFSIDGITWRSPEFLIINYVLLGLVFLILRNKREVKPLPFPKKIFTWLFVAVAIASTVFTLGRFN